MKGSLRKRSCRRVAHKVFVGITISDPDTGRQSRIPAPRVYDCGPLAVVQLGKDSYSLTHIKSGYAVLKADAPEPLKELGDLISGFDWDLSLSDIRSEHPAVPVVKAWLRRNGFPVTTRPKP